ncbi:MAG TPA: sensor histidine kinase [Dissulfurispiraceae bacterium]|nr:sensor histidine kinase [Dissulfurispiraceae bacterium]
MKTLTAGSPDCLMGTTPRIIAVSFALGAANWVFDTYIDWRYYYDASYLDLLILDVPVTEIFVRIIAFAFILAFGALMARVMAGRRRAEALLEKAKGELEARVAERTAELQQSEHHLRMLSSQLIEAQEAERRRVSRELHDELGQSLAILKLRLKSVEADLPDDGPGVRQEFDGIIRHVDHVIDEVRRISCDLSPSVLEDLGLTEALRWLTSEFEKNSALKVIFEVQGCEEQKVDHLFSEYSQTLIYRIVQEALTNITKHAGAASAAITLRVAHGEVLLSIGDDGAGFDVDAAVRKGADSGRLGLSAMRERARMLGSSVEVRSLEGKGTRISVRIPLEQGADVS